MWIFSFVGLVYLQVVFAITKMEMWRLYDCEWKCLNALGVALQSHTQCI